MLPADMGGVSAARAADLEVSGELLQDFVDRVDAVLRNLEASAGSPAKVGAQTLRPSSLSNGRAGVFPEAQSLHAQYNGVHEKLTALSKTLHLHIEAIAIGVKGAANGYDTLEDDQRRRFWAIRWELESMQDDKSGQYTREDESGMGA
ncbi:DUF2563 family protein [Streptomyces sp. NPDC050674]|uniref:DUF2563 family protein n=1 Tax=Streptomyces sp. NPDC050674 TaxID=3157216 RepID=UPI00342FFBB4